jgi:hypothetical protein
MAAVIGVLLVLLKARGTALHKAHVQILEMNLNAAQAKEDGNVETADASYQAALKAYQEASK